MPYCPKCKAEYREGFAKCVDCDVELVEELPAEEVRIEREDTSPISEDIELEKLVSANNDIELSYITSMLETEGILYRLTGTGKSMSYLDIRRGIIIVPKREIFVDKSKMNEAMAIVLSIAGEQVED